MGKYNNGPYHEPYTNLAYAILQQGKMYHDEAFLNSDWADNLREMCRLDDEMYGNRGLGSRGSISSHSGPRYNNE